MWAQLLKYRNIDTFTVWTKFPVREYKEFKVNSETSKVEAMKIRQV